MRPIARSAPGREGRDEQTSRSDRHAGTDPNSSAVATDTTATNAINLRSVSTATGAREPSAETRRRSASLPNHANARPKRRAHRRENQTLRHQLSNQPRTAHAERKTQIDFAPARGGSREQKVRDIRATDEEHEHDRCQEQLKRLRQIVREASRLPGPQESTAAWTRRSHDGRSADVLGPKMPSSTRRNVTVSLASACGTPTPGFNLPMMRSQDVPGCSAGRGQGQSTPTSSTAPTDPVTHQPLHQKIRLARRRRSRGARF